MDPNILVNLLIAVPVILMFVLMSVSQKKKAKKEQELRNNIKIGDKVVTIGGIIGTVISVKDDSFVIESQNEKLHIMKWSVASVNKGA